MGYQKTNLNTSKEPIQLEGSFLKTKISIFLISILLLSVAFAILPNSQTTNAQTSSSSWKEDFNYASLDEMQEEGFTFTRPAGISVGSGAIVLNGVE